MTLIDPAAFRRVGNPAIDHDHESFVTLLNRLDAASNTEFPGLFQLLFEHTEQHFAMEDQLMRDSRFPAEAEHTGEHQRVLGEFKQFKSRVDKGMLVFGRSFVRERLPQWFQLHVSTMDSALAAYINANGKP
ncbi:bacteriohemerythrin [Methylomonas methanica]|uniref:Hemerythrin-like metal-binding protein n=1 Tax=Methylomonas methanica (strain DSM 25384 / MC09) TaxID=857087 RepID=G0A787_METMM|nr:hemerythrin domain-containing protein [Methylomonas methanica]AEF99380.1 hemerythrin-like metal-binding protein [Methylomonas methanica MC09]